MCVGLTMSYCSFRSLPCRTVSIAAIVLLNSGSNAQHQTGLFNEQSQSRGVQTAMSFVDVSDQAGLGDAVRSIAPGSRYTPMQGGGAVGDFNNDGYHDIFMLTGGGMPDLLYINNTDGTFSEQGAGWGVDRMHHSFGASAADFNNDGYLDIFVTSYGDAASAPASGKMILYKNNGPDANGDWSFSDVGVEYGVNRLYGETRDGTGSGWGDYDLDGDLDLVVSGYNEARPCNRLFRNNGPEGNYTFTDVTPFAGIEYTEMPGFVPCFIDMNGDRYPELVMVSDTGRTRYFVNNTDGTFSDQTPIVRGVGTASAMGIDVGDINNDGLLDMYISSINFADTNGPGNVLLVQNNDGSFDNTARDNGTHAGYWGWGVLMHDFDHDGDLDLAETNGFFGSFGGKPAVLFENLDHANSFQEVAQQSGFDHNGEGRGLVRIDIENDGDLDLLVFANVGKLRLYENQIVSATTGSDRHWVRIMLDTSANPGLAPAGIGAMVRLFTPQQTLIRPMSASVSHASSSPIEVHAGLGGNAQIDVVQVQWPDGSFTTLESVDADQTYIIKARATPVDYDGDGQTDISDILTFVDLFQSASLQADHNGDLRLDFFDIAAFLQDYREATAP